MPRPPAKRSRTKARSKTAAPSKSISRFSLVMNLVALVAVFVTVPFLPASLVASLPGPIQRVSS